MKLLLASLFLFSVQVVRAQDYKLNISNGTLKFYEVHKLTIEGTTGNEVIFTSEGEKSLPERAKGLRPINSQGMQDNTGMGLAVVKESGDNTYRISDVMRNSGRYIVKVPKGIKIMIEQNSVHGSDIIIKDIPNDLEISSRYSDIELKNISGSALINNIHGGITAVFNAVTPGKPISLVSAHGPVDVTLPATSKADFYLSSGFGDIFTDLDIDFDTKEGGMKKLSSDLKGKINGGGTEIFLESKHSNIYLRKKS